MHLKAMTPPPAHNNLKLEGNAAMKVVSAKLVEGSLMIHYGLRVSDANWLVGTLRKGMQR